MTDFELGKLCEQWPTLTPYRLPKEHVSGGRMACLRAKWNPKIFNPRLAIL